MKSKCAVFTIVKNERIFLPIWIKHYKKYFDASDIYILDHQSTDGSTENLDVNVILVENEFAFDHTWFHGTVEKFHIQLLQKYQAVLFSDGDELVYTVDKPLNETIDLFLSNEDCKFQTCHGYEIIQDMQRERSLLDHEEILPNRNYWYYSKLYCKTLLSKVPLSWCVGFHITNPPTHDTTYNLYLCPLHKYDFEQMLKRHQERKANWKYHSDVVEKGMSWHNAIADRQGILFLFNLIDDPIIPIPEIHKQSLKGI